MSSRWNRIGTNERDSCSLIRCTFEQICAAVKNRNGNKKGTNIENIAVWRAHDNGLREAV